jgi:hypothetical protein
MKRAAASELVYRIEGYDEGRFEVVGIFLDEKGNYCIEVKENKEEING